MIKLRRFLKDYKKECIIGPLCKLFEAILELIVPLVMADIIDNGVTNGDKGYVLRMGLVMVALAATGLLSALVCQYFASKASQGFGTKVRRALFSHINSLSHAELDKLGTPSLITRITNDVNQSQQMVAMTIRLLTRAPFIVIGSIIMAMTISVRMSIIFIIAAVIIGLILYFVMTKSIPIFSLMQKKLDKIGLVSRENLSGNRVIRAFSKQKSEKERIDNSTEDLAATSIRISRLSALLNPATYVVTDVAIIAIIWFGGINVDAGNMQTGDIIALVSYMTQILLAMIVVANLVLLMTKGSASAARINEVLETEPSVKETTKEIISVNTDENTPKIAFDNVSFSYGGGDDELSKISFEIKRGSTVGIIGGTGSGKSTLINLIPRFYDVSKGCVRVNGRDVKDYDLVTLRDKIGVVMQKAVLFQGTIEENLRWGNPDATEEELWKAIEVAQATDVVEGKEGKLSYMVEQGGRNLSGGQKQRLTIARAVVKDPDILILDDSASALDFATDAKLRSALRNLQGNKTIFIVSQRTSSIQFADQIIVMDDGQAVGIGTHEQLLENCEIYREIYESQFKKEDLQKQKGGAF